MPFVAELQSQNEDEHLPPVFSKHLTESSADDWSTVASVAFSGKKKRESASLGAAATANVVVLKQNGTHICSATPFFFSQKKKKETICEVVLHKPEHMFMCLLPT